MRWAGFRGARPRVENSGKPLKSWRVPLWGVLVVLLFGLAAPGHAQTTVAGVTPGALSVDAMGQANYSIPIDVPPGIAGMEPSLALNYSSGGGNGIAGMGWSISGLSAITRCAKTLAQDGTWGGVNYDAEDRFCLDGKRLVAVSGVYGADGTEYRTEIDGFFRIVSYGKVTGSTGLQGSSPVWFRAWAKSGQIMDYGATEDSRVQAVFTPAPAPETPPEVRAWAVSHIADTVGNTMTFSYFEDTLTGAHRVDNIAYTRNDTVTAQSSVQFVYEARPDIASGYPGNALVTSGVRLANIRTWTDAALVRDYRLAYETGAATGRSRLLSVTECDGVGGLENCLAPASFAWKPGNAGFAHSSEYKKPRNGGTLIDVDGDGLDDLVWASSAYRATWLNTGSGWVESPEYLPPFDIATGGILGGIQGEFIDVNGDGLPDFVRAVMVQSTSYRTTWLNTGSGWQESVAHRPVFDMYRYWSKQVREGGGDGDNWTEYQKERRGDFVDINGDGLVDFVQSSKTAQNTTWLNTGNGWSDSAAYLPPFSKWAYDIYSPNTVQARFAGYWPGGRSEGEYVDVDGNGLLDFVRAVRIQGIDYRTTWLNTGAGWQENAALQVPSVISSYFWTQRCDKDGCYAKQYYSQRYGDFADVNEDGLVDFMHSYKGNDGQRAWLNTGNNWQESTSYQPIFARWANDNYPQAGTFDPNANIGNYFPKGRFEGKYIDVNGDGLVDFVRANKLGLSYRTTWLNTGMGWLEELAYTTGFDIVSNSTKRKCEGGGGDCWTVYVGQIFGDFADADGDGLRDFVEHGVGGNTVRDTWLTDSVAPDQLLSVTDSLGSTTSLSYLPLTDTTAVPPVYEKLVEGEAPSVLPVQDIQAPLYVVSAVSQPDGVGGQAVTRYSYAGAKVDTTGRGFLGFRFMDATDEQTGIVTTTRYAQGFPYTGQVEATETYIPDASGLTGGTTLARTTNTFAQKSLNLGATIFPYVSQSVAESYEFAHGNDNLPVTTTTTDSVFDDYGNPTKITVKTGAGTETFTTATDSIYTNDTVNWYLGRVTRTAVTNTLPDLRSATRVSAFAYDPLTGLLSQEVIEPDSLTLSLTTDYTRDAFGHIATTTVSGPDIASRTTTTEFDPAAPNYGRFATRAVNALGHAETRTHDARFGALASVIGPNGITTTWTYDSFGRKTREDRADGTASVMSYDLCTTQCPTGGVYAVSTQNVISGVAPAPDVPHDARRVGYYDALNRVFRTETQGFDGRLVYIDTMFNALGQVEKVSRPYFDGTAAVDIQWTTTTYDGIGRVKSITGPNSGVETTDYDGLSIFATNALGQLQMRVSNAIGQLIRSIDDAGASIFYSYDPFGNLESTDTAGVLAVFTHDIRGRKRSMTDTNMGIWSYDYNALGEMVKQTDAKGQITTMTYDLLGRMTTRTEAEGTTTWVYDNALKTAGIGKLDRISRTEDDYLLEPFYDAHGRPQRTETTYEGRTYLQSTTYDSASRPDVLTYPTASDGSRFAVENVYNGLGYLDSVREFGGAGTVYWQAVAVNAAGQVTEESLGNGLTTLRGFDAATGLIDTIGTYNGLTPLQDHAYDFDFLGNLKSRADRLRDREETFNYDTLNRLRGATVIDTVTLGILGQTTANYDTRGNLTYKSDVGTYSYNGIDGGLHAVTQAGNKTYRYDGNGAMVASADATTGAALRSIAWSSFNKPTRIDALDTLSASEFVYGPSRARIKQATYQSGLPAKTITYVGGGFERHAIAGSATDELVHYIRAGNTVAMFKKIDDGIAATDRTQYLHRDHIGSVTMVTDAAGAVVEERSYDAWGKPRNADWTPAVTEVALSETKRGFTGHEHLDNVGLIHMNGRVYDPTLGRFISGDPFVQAPANTQSYNRYSYVLNNPLSFTDPSGFWSLKNVFRDIGKGVKWLFSNPVTSTILQVVAVTVGGMLCGPACAGLAAGAFSAAQTAVMGGNLGEILGNGLISGFIGGMAYGVTAYFDDLASFGLTAAQKAGKIFAHGVIGGIQSAARGGKATAGFLAGAFGQMSPGLVGKIPGKGLSGQMSRTMAASVAGGVGAKLGGGKFANGAFSGAFQRLLLNPADSPPLLADVAQKIWNLPNTVAGLVVGFAGHVYGEIGNVFGFYTPEPGLNFRSGVIEFTNNPTNTTAMSWGNTIIYSAGCNPTDPRGQYNLAHQEYQHTVQGYMLGILYFPAHVIFGVTAKLGGQDWHGSLNLLETGPHTTQNPKPW